MPKTMKKDRRVDVSGDVDERGRLVNKDVPEDARRSAKKGKKRKDDRKARVTELVVEEAGVKKRKKKRVQEEEELPVKKKKGTRSTAEKRKSKEDKPATTKALAKMERRKEKLLADMEYLPAVQGAGAGDEFDTQYRGMFENLQTITELFEEKMMKDPSSRDVYALSTLYSQMREVIADIRSAKDVTQQIAELESKAYGAFLQLVGQSYVDLFFKLQKDIRTYVKDKDAQQQLIASLQGLCKDQGDKVQQGYSTMLERVRTVLL